MTATRTQARDEILGVFKTAWDADVTSASVQVIYPDNPDQPPNDNSPFTRLNIIHSPEGNQVTLQNEIGSRRFRRFGICISQVFTVRGDGLNLSDQLSTIARNAFEGVVTSPGGVIFRNVNAIEVGPSGIWFQVNVIANFEYDEVK